MTVATPAAVPGIRRPCAGWFRVRAVYFRLLVALTLTVALASFVRDRGQLLSNISLWLFLVPFAVSLWRTQVGLLTAVALLTVAPSLHEQLNVLAGTRLHAWAYPGVDCCLGFLTACVLKGEMRSADDVLERFPSGLLLLVHAWVALSAFIAIGRNLWQSASEFSLRGLAYNVWLMRVLSFQEDYFPLHDLFFYSVATALLFSVWTLALDHGDRIVRRLAAVSLAGACANALFAVWQKTTGKGWVVGRPDLGLNAFWPDIHSFGPLMAFAIVLGYGLVQSRVVSPVAKSAIVATMLAAAIGLNVSESRSTFLILCLLIGAVTIWSAFTLRGWRRAVSIAGLVSVLVLLDRFFTIGYRGVSYVTLNAALHSLDFQAFNSALSYRPEIWGAALAMYSSFPIFGLGQGAFYRLSSIAQFSGSDVLVGLGGNGAHNYILQTFVELGPVGLGVSALIAIPFLRLGRENLRLISFYALIGIAVGNVFAHSLLVREMLMLAAVFAGTYIWEAQTLVASRWRPPGKTTVRYASIVLTGVLLAAVVEVALSLDRAPFTFGQRCLEAHPLEKDGWTKGTLSVPVPPAATSAVLTILADRPDLSWRPLDLQVLIVDGEDKPVLQEAVQFSRGDEGPRSVTLPLGAYTDGKRFLELRPSHCFVPRNLGLNPDTRHLGVRVTKLQFVTASGSDPRE